jgi:glycerol-1-phosphate dehydrogenase [NAD(P)+]
MLTHFGAERGNACWAEFKQKMLDPDTAEAMNARIEARWPEIQRRIGTIRLPAHTLETALKRAEAPTTPAALGWTPAFYNQAVRHAREIRNRWTILDLAADAGLLDEPHLAVSA